MTVLWTLNGYFQSMLWGPLMKTINQWFPQKQKSKMALYMFSSVISGFLLTWGGLGQISSYTGWKGVFWIPGVFLLLYSFIWYLYARNNPEEVGLCLEDAKSYTEDTISYTQDRKLNTLNTDELSTAKIGLNLPRDTPSMNLSDKNFNIESNETQHTSLLKLVFNTRLYLIAIAGIPLGFVREGISLWAPAMLFDTFQLNLQSTMSAALLIPLFNFMGVIATRLLINKLQNNEIKLAAIFFTGGIFTCILLYFFKNSGIITYLVLLALCSLSLYGASSIITSVIPLKYHMTSSVAGFLDFSIYLGAGMSGILTGFLSNKFGWSIVVLVWVIAGAVGSTCMYTTAKKNSN